ncbi:MAG: HdeD family acid-resistance protein [Planctomycetaceae bacterium]|nr:HdeD family acid-resistance protein [Planctomycetaceae bacterium]
MEPTLSASPRERIVECVSRLWWLMLLRGILLIIVGVCAFAQPGITLLAFTKVLGAFEIVDGVFALIAGVFGWAESRIWEIVRGLLGIGIGVFVLAHPLLVGAIAATIIVLFIAFQSIAGGVLEIIVAIRERKELTGEGWLILSGVFSIIFGIILLSAPFASSLILIQVLGAFAVFFGCLLIVNSFRVRNLKSTVAPA